MLAPHVPFDPEESPLSYAARLAGIHTGGRLIPFLRDLEFEPEDMAANKEEALSRLAELSGVPIGDLRANAPVPLGGRTYVLRGELVTAEFLANPHTMFCPACLAEDDRGAGRRGRWQWTLSVVRTCPRHKIALMRRTKKRWDDPFHELDRRVPERGEQLEADASTRLSHIQIQIKSRATLRASYALLFSKILLCRLEPTCSGRNSASVSSIRSLHWPTSKIWTLGP